MNQNTIAGCYSLSPRVYNPNRTQKRTYSFLQNRELVVSSQFAFVGTTVKIKETPDINIDCSYFVSRSFLETEL